MSHGVAVVGCGNVGLTRHIPAWRSGPHGYHLAAVVDPDPRRREAGRVAGGLDAADAYGDIDTVLARADIGVLDICIPPSLRPQLVHRAAQAGKHILAEKPIAVTPAAAESMTGVCRDFGVTLGVIHNFLFFPEIMRARALIEAGAIGDVEVVLLNYLGAADNPGAAEYRPSWRHDVSMSGGGVLMDMIHVVYLAEALLGQPIEAVSGFVTARESGGIEDIASCRFESRDAIALVNVGWGFGPGGIDISGSTGRISIRYRGGGTSPFVPLERMELTTGKGTATVDVPTTDDYMDAAVTDFAAALDGSGRPAADGEHALHILEATVAAYASAATGVTVGLPLDRADPVFAGGIAGLSADRVTPGSMVARKGLFGVTTPAR